MKVILTADHAGVTIRNEVKQLLEEKGIPYEDAGTDGSASVDYPDYSLAAAKRIAAGEFDRGIFICGTGIGMSIAANKVKGIRCALVHDVYSAKMTRLHNDSNVIALGERVIGAGLARKIVETWLDTSFEGGRHNRRVEKITTYESE